MKGLRVGATFIIVLVIFLLSVFQMQMRGYEKIGRAEEWTIYYKDEDSCATMIEVFYIDENYEYSFNCLMSDRYLIKSGFEEHSLVFALENGYIEISELEEIIDFNKTEIDD